MGIQVYDEIDDLLALGFHSIRIPFVDALNIEYWYDIDIWCQKYLQGEYAIERLLTNGCVYSAGFFRSDADVMMFTLRWL